MKNQTKTDRNPFSAPLVLAIILAALSLLLAAGSHGCSPELIKPVVKLCEPACEVAHTVCVTATALIPDPTLTALASVGCDAGLGACKVGCAEAEAAYGSADACGVFLGGCLDEGGDPESCQAGFDACLQKLAE